MASVLDHKQIAEDADLTPGELEHFVAGLAGEIAEPLLLVRDVYDELQRILEERALAARDSGEQVWDEALGFWYFTVNPPTPSYRPEHPRRENLMRMFSTAGQRGPSACSVFSLRGYLATESKLSPIQRRAFVDFLRGSIPKSGPSSVCVTRRDLDPSSANYFVLGRGGDREPVAFSAMQSSPTEPSSQSGAVRFGMGAEEMRLRVLREYEGNYQDWDAREILHWLVA